MNAVHEIAADDLIALTQAEPTLRVHVPAYQADGRTRLQNEEGALVEYAFTLHRPTTASGLRFAKFQRGKTKGKKVTLPSQQEMAIEAIRICVPDLESHPADQVLNLIVRTGGYLGENAKLVNACMSLLGQNMGDSEEEEDEPQRWASDDDLPS